ncbi:MAG: response regulator [Chloroflexota bacterium]|nr:response regulator [Chloroflexota bacterium]
MNILLVEDEAALADVIARNLRARQHDTAIAASAGEAIAAMEERWPDVLILDVNLPDLTGWEILRRLTVLDRSRLRVIVISAAPISPKRIEEFQPLRILQKPFPISALVRMLSEGGPSPAAESDAEAPWSDES